MFNGLPSKLMLSVGGFRSNTPYLISISGSYYDFNSFLNRGTLAPLQGLDPTHASEILYWVWPKKLEGRRYNTLGGPNFSTVNDIHFELNHKIRNFIEYLANNIKFIELSCLKDLGTKNKRYSYLHHYDFLNVYSILETHFFYRYVDNDLDKINKQYTELKSAQGGVRF